MDYRVANFTDYQASGGLGKWDSGILEVEIYNWIEYEQEVNRLLELGDFFWRGQRCDWPLESKFDRIVKSNRSKRLKNLEENFRHAILGRRGTNPSKLEPSNELWSLGQHYGLATPLLDWTDSPFVAAYFAFQEKDRPDDFDKSGMDTGHRFVYALSEDLARWGFKDSSKKLIRYVQIVRPLSDENPRLLNQRGIFTTPVSGGINLEERVRKCYKDDPEKGKSRIIFIKIKVDKNEREKGLCNLSRMNISHATLFPDLIGAAEYCNMKLEIENYS